MLACALFRVRQKNFMTFYCWELFATQEDMQLWKGTAIKNINKTNPAYSGNNCVSKITSSVPPLSVFWKGENLESPASLYVALYTQYSYHALGFSFYCLFLAETSPQAIQKTIKLLKISHLRQQKSTGITVRVWRVITKCHWQPLPDWHTYCKNVKNLVHFSALRHQ